MFSLIITIISISLVVALAVATVFYGGGAFSTGGEEAKVTAVQSQGAQIRGAMDAYKVNEGGLPTGTESEIKQLLVDRGYLKAFPSDGGAPWKLINDYAYVEGLSDEQCKAVNAKYGITGDIPICGVGTAGKTLCCSNVVTY